MITLHLREYFKTLAIKKKDGTTPIEYFWEKLPLDKNGVAIYSVGGERAYGRRTMSQLFELESRGDDDLYGMHVLEKIAEHLSDGWVICDLPLVPGVSEKQYTNCRIVNMGNVTNLGLDANDRLIFKLTAQIIYKKGN